MGDIRQLSDSGSRDPYPSAFIQCVDGIDPMIHELWCHGIDGLCCEVHPTARIDISVGNTGELVTEYLISNGRSNHIIG